MMQNVIAIEITNLLNIRKSLLFDAVLILIGTIFVSFCSQFAYYLPFSPIPITGQTLAVLLTGAFLGSKRGGLTLSLYVFEGLIGLPVFAGGTSGFSVLAGPTFGYLIGFVFAAVVVGLLAEKGYDRLWYMMAFTFMIGQVTIYFFGVLWLVSFVGVEHVLELGVAPFLIGDIFKVGLAMILMPSLWNFIEKSKTYKNSWNIFIKRIIKVLLP